MVKKKYLPAYRKATKKYLSTKKGFTAHFDEELFYEMKELGINTTVVKELILAEYEKRKQQKQS
jgi:hypothetical protein